MYMEWLVMERYGRYVHQKSNLNSQRLLTARGWECSQYFQIALIRLDSHITFFAKCADVHKLGSKAIIQLLQGASQPYAPWDTVSSFIYFAST